jgi:hypothetical protein
VNIKHFDSKLFMQSAKGHKNTAKNQHFANTIFFVAHTTPIIHFIMTDSTPKRIKFRIFVPIKEVAPTPPLWLRK